MNIEKSLINLIEKETCDKNPVLKNSGEFELTSKGKEELKRFRNFWSGRDGVFEDEEMKLKRS
jgi:DNA-binding PadR family transcriptional regulator